MKIITVSQLNTYIKNIFENDYALKNIYIKGEVSNCKYHSSGHIYFSLKDEKASIRCVMFSSYVSHGLKFTLTNGMSVLAGGSINVYERDGVYQLYVKDLVSAGTGDLYLKYEQLKKYLSDKGYFDEDRKKELPLFPKRIGIVTAATGAAIQDILSVAKRRDPYISLFLYPAKVQGEGAAKTIADGIRFFDSFGVDGIIIGRGGGSIEDLWAFNELEVAQAIYDCKTAIISGTGHETDYTIADFCADVRAATPTAAAQLIIPDIFEILMEFDTIKERLDNAISCRLDAYQKRIDSYEQRLSLLAPQNMLKNRKLRCAELCEKLNICIENRLKDALYRYRVYIERLEANSPLKKLGGGYVYVRDENEKVLRSVEDTKPEASIELTFIDGKIKAKVEQIVKGQF